MSALVEVVTYCNKLLEVARFKDYCPNGLQIEGKPDIRSMVTAVTASLDVIEQAVDKKADALLVHHGFFWKGESPELVGSRRKRIKPLLENDISLIAYHLPLDAHPVYGNNVQLGNQLGLTVDGSFGKNGDSDLALLGTLSQPMQGKEFAALIQAQLGRKPLHIATHNRSIHKVAWCTGGAQSYFDLAIDYGIDAFITGEVSEQNFHSAMEAKVDFIAAGHHATERYGVQSLGEHLITKFDIKCDYIEILNPI